MDFLAALYNEEKTIDDLIFSVAGFIDTYYIVDDGSTDSTSNILNRYAQITGPMCHENGGPCFIHKTIAHTGLPETVKAEALSMVFEKNNWVLMLDADERVSPWTIHSIYEFTRSPEAEKYTHVWFTLQEFIEGQYTRTFQKCRLFRASAANFSTSVHEDDTFTGQGASFGWTVEHSKTKEKQIMREIEYIHTYAKLLEEGKITKERIQDLRQMHYFVK